MCSPRPIPTDISANLAIQPIPVDSKIITIIDRDTFKRGGGINVNLVGLYSIYIKWFRRPVQKCHCNALQCHCQCIDISVNIFLQPICEDLESKKEPAIHSATDKMPGPKISWHEKSIMGCGLWSGLDFEIKGSGPIMSNFWGPFFKFLWTKN